MCDICLQSPCHSRCPNADPPIYGHCEICGDPIYDQEMFYELDEHIYCESCVFDGYKTAEVDYE